MPFVEDFSPFLADFGVPATLAGAAVRGIFDNGYSLGAVGAMGMASTEPVFTLPSAQVPADPVGLPLAVAGRAYLVAAHEPDGLGVSRLLLELAT